MPNRINKAIVSEYSAKFGEAPDMVAVDINGLTVEEASDFRNRAREKDIEVFVVKTTLAKVTLKDQVTDNGSEAGLDQVINGPTALVFGGEGMPDVARLVHDIGKETGKLTVRGGVFDKQVIEAQDVSKFRDIPDRQTLLSQVLATIIAPLTGTLAAAQSLLSAPASLADALAKKQEEGS